jgi:AraC-like DNA-binding protein
MSISQIAHVYRFSDASHFTRMHRIYYGVTPAQARAGLRQTSLRTARATNGIVAQILSGGLFIFG